MEIEIPANSALYSLLRAAMLGNESILKVHYRIEGDVLYRHQSDPSAVERIIPWGPDAAAFRLASDGWHSFVPDMNVCRVEQIAWHQGPSRLPGWLSRVDACRFLIERWPQEARDSVRGLPSKHWQLVQFGNFGGAPALELLQSNPALAYLATVAGKPAQIGLRRRTLAGMCRFPETEHAVRLLRKVPAAWISGEFLEQLRLTMINEPNADAVVTRLRVINPIALEVARDPELRAAITPDCLARLSRIPPTIAHCDLIARIRGLLDRARGHTLPPPRIDRLSDIDRPVCAAPAQVPAPPRIEGAFPTPPLPDVAVPGVRIQAIRGRAELIAEGAEMHHCAGTEQSYARRVARGRMYFYRMTEPERLTIAICLQGRWWNVEEIRGVCNREPTVSSDALIRNWVREAVEFGIASRPVGPGRPAVSAPIVLRLPQLRSRHRAVPQNQLAFNFSLVV